MINMSDLNDSSRVDSLPDFPALNLKSSPCLVNTFDGSDAPYSAGVTRNRGCVYLDKKIHQQVEHFRANVMLSEWKR